jgi:transcriptional regulator with XRE-family HTH domain
MPKGVPIFGDEFKKIRGELLITQSELARRLEVSLGSIQRIEGLVVASISAKTIRKMAEITGATVAGVLERIRVPQDYLDKMPAYKPNLDQVEDGETPAKSETSNVDSESETRFFEIPMFDLKISAGRWTEVNDYGETNDPRSIDQGLFRVRLSGDSMENKFPDGSIVEFRVIRPSSPTIEIGKHYYVHRSDGTATFKTLKNMDETTLTLSAFNKKKYPKPMAVDRQEVVRIAVAVNIVEAV